MIDRRPDREFEVPSADLATHVLEGAPELGAKPVLIEGASGRTLTYADLARDVPGLLARGFSRGDTLALLMPNLPEFGLTLLGAASAGGKCTTVNPLVSAKSWAASDAGGHLRTRRLPADARE